MSRKKKVLSKRSNSSPNRRIAASKVVVHPPRNGITRYAKKNIFWAESYSSLLMGVVVIIVAVLFAVSLVRQTRHIQDTTSSSIGPTLTSTQEQPSSQTFPKSYTVTSGDDLWHIAENAYGSGYNWVDIASANNLTDPSQIFSGNVLILPDVAKKEPTTQVALVSPLGQVMQQAQTITQKTYKVASGDTLWDIAVRAYADGYKWVEIAKANNLNNPDVIYSGTVLKLPR